MSDTKTCPYCAEEIKLLAKICRFCSRGVESEAESGLPANDTTIEKVKAPKNNATQNSRKQSVIGIIVGGLATIWAIGILLGIFDAPTDAPQTARAPDIHDISTRNASIICKAADGLGMHSKPCEVSGWASSIDIHMDATAADARQICAGMRQTAISEGMEFGKGWQIRIFSPYSNGNTIAACNL